jgi:hypothetical protein
MMILKILTIQSLMRTRAIIRNNLIEEIERACSEPDRLLEDAIKMCEWNETNCLIPFAQRGDEKN